MDRLLYPALLAFPLSIYGVIQGRVPFQIAPSLAVLPFLVVVATLEILRPYHGPWSVRPGQKHLAVPGHRRFVQAPPIHIFCESGGSPGPAGA